MSPEPARKLNSGTGVAAAPAGFPTTGTPPGAWRGAGRAQRFGATVRSDRWWLVPLIQALGLVALLGYANYAAILGQAHYHYVADGRDYLSPFYSPYIHPAWLPAWLSPALLILVFPLGFRATCYYYRKAYYRSFFADPIACAVGEGRKSYCGEVKFPFLLQNLHRYFLYAALVFLIFLWIDVVRAFIFTETVQEAIGRVRVEGGQLISAMIRQHAVGERHYFGVGVGSLAILFSTGMLTLYT